VVFELFLQQLRLLSSEEERKEGRKEKEFYEAGDELRWRKAGNPRACCCCSMAAVQESSKSSPHKFLQVPTQKLSTEKKEKLSERQAVVAPLYCFFGCRISSQCLIRLLLMFLRKMPKISTST